MKIRELSGRTRIAVMIRDFCWKCRWSVLGVNYPWLGWKCGKTWKIYGNIKKHLKIIHGRSNHSWHELFLGVSLYFCKSSPFCHIFNQQTEKLKSREMKEVWMKDEWRMMKDEGWVMRDDYFKLLRGFASWQTDRQTDIGECRVAFETEIHLFFTFLCQLILWWCIQCKDFQSSFITPGLTMKCKNCKCKTNMCIAKLLLSQTFYLNLLSAPVELT